MVSSVSLRQSGSGKLVIYSYFLFGMFALFYWKCLSSSFTVLHLRSLAFQSLIPVVSVPEDVASCSLVIHSEKEFVAARQLQNMVIHEFPSTVYITRQLALPSLYVHIVLSSNDASHNLCTCRYSRD